MNVKGIELLRKLKLAGPKKELVFTNLKEVNLSELYKDAKHGATIMTFDYDEPINQNALYEKSVRKYEIKKENYVKEFNLLIKELEKKNVLRKNMKFVTHQTYLPEDIAFSGRVSIVKDKDGFGLIHIEAVNSLRKGRTNFTPTFIYQCKIVAGRLLLSQEHIIKKEFVLPASTVKKILDDVYKISGNPNVDFAAYADNNQIFYHDLFLDNK
jgi:hypothetical protein